MQQASSSGRTHSFSHTRCTRTRRQQLFARRQHISIHICKCAAPERIVDSPTPKIALHGDLNPVSHTPVVDSQVQTVFIAETLLPTRQGNFRLRGYKHSVDAGVTFTEPTAIISGRVEGADDVAVRVHDACFTSEVLGSLKCDCAEQLQLALSTIQNNPPGMVIYLQQEGRGIGLANKIAAYAMQEKGLDTVDANRVLGFPDDCREYTSVRNILNDLGVRSIRLMTNNPRKIAVLQALGVEISGRLPCVVEAGAYNQGYLQTKAAKMDHLLDGSWCYWNHDGEPVQPTTATQKGGMGVPIPAQNGKLHMVSAVAKGRSAADPAWEAKANGNGVNNQ